MNLIKLNSSIQNNSTNISNYFIDTIMPSANGEFVKIYIYILRCFSNSLMTISISDMADKFNHTENDILRALRYWDKEGLIKIHYDNSNNITEINLTDLTKHNASNNNSDCTISTVVKNTAKIAKSPAKPEYSSQQLKAFATQEDLKQLIYITEKYLGKTLSANDTNTIIYFYDTLKFPTDLIEYLIEYCVTKEHRSMRYIEKIALSWADAGINTIAAAKEDAAMHNNTAYSVMKAFGITGRNPGKAELDYINKWNTQYGFNSEIITAACNRTIEAIHQPSFEYADSILLKWKEKEVSNLQDIQNLDNEFARSKTAKERNNRTPAKASTNKFNNFPQRSYDFDELEKQLINNSNL